MHVVTQRVRASLSLGAALVALVGCSTPSAPSSAGAPVEVSVDAPTSSAPRTVPSSRPAASIPPVTPASGTAAPNDEQWACSAPAECVQTCALGAVAVGWLRKHPDADTCDDGCGWKHGQTTCHEGKCVTANPDGTVDDGCSFRPFPPVKR